MQWQCLGNLFSLLGINYRWGVIIGVVVVAVYTNIGGNNGSSIVGAAQTVICVVVCIIVAIIACNACGGFTNMNLQFAAIDPGLVTATSDAYPLPRCITFMIGNMAGLGQPYLLVKYFQIKDTRALPKAMPMCMIGTFFTCIIVIIGVAMRVLTTNGTIGEIAHIDSMVPEFIAQVVNPSSIVGPIIGGLVIAAALSAIMSTASALTLNVSGSLVNDIWVKWLHHDTDSQKLVKLGRYASFAVTIVSCLLALFPSGTIFYVGFAAASMFGTAFAPAMIGGLRWRRSTKHGAFWSMLIGFLLHITLYILNSSGVMPWPLQGRVELNGFCMLFSAVLYIVISLLTPAQEKPLLPPKKSELKLRTKTISA